MRIRNILFPILLLLGMAACGRGAGLDGLAAGEQGRVADVLSGDALTLDSGLEVRLAGVEAPRRDQPYAPEALQALRTLADGRTVRLYYGGARRDRYGRALAQVKLVKSGRWLQEALLRQGAARVRTWADNRALAGPMLEAEAYARNRSRGLWKLPAYRVLLPGEASSSSGFQILEARVRSLSAGPTGAPRLELTSRPGLGVAAEIASKALGDFKAAGKAPEQLRGRHVRLRGYVRYGPVMILDHPEQVELLREQD
jgi:endonuclease YncB( thermonuclease family)